MAGRADHTAGHSAAPSSAAWGDQARTSSVKSGGGRQPDSSLHMFTASVRSLKHWSQYKQKAPMMFELFGTSACFSYTHLD